MILPKAHSKGNKAMEKTPRQTIRVPLLEVPEYPMLASGVELVGEMEETGFEERQWLVRRGERFLQLSELLYRVAERADGESTHEEMAEGVTRSTDWLVSAENVRKLLQSKLLPLGLVAPAEDSALRDVRAGERTASLLRVNGRTRLLEPSTINPITKVLQILFTPLILVPVLLVVGLAHAWLYSAHGVSGAVRDVLYAPGLLLVVLGILFISGIFHEFGHAAALRYGGGRVRGMGAGFYLVYPALYTDTTDAYRLGRWARVRTDLGGFYFHLIFALGLIGFYVVTGWEFLLLAVLLINLGIVYQCMPFVRFDGYWTLADLTGIPDFFSQMGAFLRSVLPVRRWKGERLPDLKPWVKAVFALYVIVTVPVLSLLLFLLVTSLPGIATTVWDSLLLLAREFSLALDEGNLVGMALLAVQLFILGIQVLGISYLLYALGRMLLVALWRRIGLARRRDDPHRASEPARIFRYGP
jgi:putative peptide zinc metalloprotease protein